MKTPKEGKKKKKKAHEEEERRKKKKKQQQEKNEKECFSLQGERSEEEELCSARLETFCCCVVFVSFFRRFFVEQLAIRFRGLIFLFRKIEKTHEFWDCRNRNEFRKSPTFRECCQGCSNLGNSPSLSFILP